VIVFSGTPILIDHRLDLIPEDILTPVLGPCLFTVEGDELMIETGYGGYGYGGYGGYSSCPILEEVLPGVGAGTFRPVYAIIHASPFSDTNYGWGYGKVPILRVILEGPGIVTIKLTKDIGSGSSLVSLEGVAT